MIIPIIPTYYASFSISANAYPVCNEGVPAKCQQQDENFIRIMLIRRSRLVFRFDEGEGKRKERSYTLIVAQKSEEALFLFI